MRILGIDTSSEITGVALLEDERLLADYRIQAAGLHAEHLSELIHRMVADLKRSIGEIEGFALTMGPGSFTGLRVGLSTVKGLRTRFRQPVVGLSTLETMASAVLRPAIPICPMLDAKKGEVYVGLFSPGGSGQLIRTMEDHVEDPVSLVRHLSPEVLFLGSGAFKYRGAIEEAMGPGATFLSDSELASMASTVARLGLDRINRGEEMELDQMTPVYIRPADAELQLERNFKKE